MKMLRFIVVLSVGGCIAVSAGFAQSKGLELQSKGLGTPKSVVPKAGFVPTEAVAVTIAEAVLVPVYGKEQIASELPLNAKLVNDVWIVTGSLNCHGPPESICPGGTAEVRISKKTGRIVFMTHYQ